MTPATLPKSPISERVVVSVTGKNAEGKSTAASVVAFFGKATYTFQIMADTEEESAKIAKATESLKEL